MAAWQRVSRVGTPEVHPDEHQQDQVKLVIGTAPTAPSGWKSHFADKIRQLGVHAVFNYKHGSDGEGIAAIAPEASFEDAIKAIDEAINYANDQYETNDLPLVKEYEEHVEAEKKAAANRQARLDERAANFAMPGEPAWQRHRRSKT